MDTEVGGSSTSREIPWIDDDISWSTTEMPFTTEEQDAIVTLVVIVIGVFAAIIALFSMGIFIDCRHQKSDLAKKKGPFKLKMPPLGRRRTRRDDGHSLAADMCPNGTNNFGAQDDDAIV